MKVETRTLPLLPNDAGVPEISALATPGKYSLAEYPRTPQNMDRLTESGVAYFELDTEDTLASGGDPYLIVHNYPDSNSLAAYLRTLDDDTRNNVLAGVMWQPVQFNNFEDLVENAGYLKQQLHDGDYPGMQLPPDKLIGWVAGSVPARNVEPEL